jgi:hypothetical protein
MAAVFFPTLLRPFGQYRHGFDPPNRPTRYSFFPPGFDFNHSPLACPSNFFTLSIISQRLLVIEPFIKAFRPTTTNQRYLNLPMKLEGSDLVTRNSKRTVFFQEAKR